jgi:hypothetical protein
MPHEWAQQMDRSIQIDTLGIRNGKIRYAKRPAGVAATGEILFDDLWARGTNITTDSARPSGAPAVLRARTRVNGAGVLRTTLRVPLQASRLRGAVQGQLGPMAAPSLNQTFVPLGGVRIESGTVDSLRFQFDVERGRAEGGVHGVYRNLEIETLDEDTV